MKKLTLDPESLTVETFEASNYADVVRVETGTCANTFQTTGPWFCAADCGGTL